MSRAYERGLLIPAFNAAYPEMVKPICDTLKKLETYGICEVARPDIEKFGARGFDVIFDEFRKHADPSFVSLHQDHVPVIDEDGESIDYLTLLRQTLDLGFDSVMIDGSRLPLDDNIRITEEVVKIAHAKDTPVEAELGAVGEAVHTLHGIGIDAVFSICRGPLSLEKAMQQAPDLLARCTEQVVRAFVAGKGRGSAI